MTIKRRKFINVSLAGAATGLVTSLTSYGDVRIRKGNHQNAGLTSMVEDAKPITVGERKDRIAKAQRLLNENDMKALVLDCGTSLLYFTGVSWWPSERTMAAIIPVSGPIRYVCPAFEEGRLREMISIVGEVDVWQEDENPFTLVARAINGTGSSGNRVAVEEQTRFFVLDGIRQAAPKYEYVNADPVVIPCRVVKSAAELALMQKATDITIVAMQRGINGMKAGMTPGDVSSVIADAHARLGAVHDFAVVSFGPASASPHGSRMPQTLKKGDVVMLDCGCRVHGYSSDITRTVVFGAKPTPRQVEIWNLEKRAQTAGFAAAQLGAPCEAVDAASRKVIADAGFGPGYKLPGLPHRTGHGIGMDGHEWAYIVKGNKQLLQPGMCFSIEPTISIPGEFGVRHEDCVFMTEEGPQWFSQPSPSIAQPFA